MLALAGHRKANFPKEEARSIHGGEVMKEGRPSKCPRLRYCPMKPATLLLLRAPFSGHFLVPTNALLIFVVTTSCLYRFVEDFIQAE